MHQRTRRLSRALSAVVVALAWTASTGVALAATPPQPTVTVTTPAAVPVPTPDAAPTATTPAPAAPKPAVPAPSATIIPAAPAKAPATKATPKKIRPAHTRPKPHPHKSAKPTLRPTAKALKPAATPTPAAARPKPGHSNAQIGAFAAGALLLVILLAIAVKTTVSALKRDDTKQVEPAMTTRPEVAAAVAAMAATARAKASEPTPDPATTEVPTTPIAEAPADPEAIAITLWRGYTKSQFIARGGPTGTGAVVASSKPFRWRTDREQHAEGAVIAFAELLATLAESGWRAEEQGYGPEWYEAVLHHFGDEPEPLRPESLEGAQSPLPTSS